MLTGDLTTGTLRNHSLNKMCPCGPCGATDNASDYGSEDSRFESWQGRLTFCMDVHVQPTQNCVKPKCFTCHFCTLQFRTRPNRMFPNYLQIYTYLSFLLLFVRIYFAINVVALSYHFLSRWQNHLFQQSDILVNSEWPFSSTVHSTLSAMIACPCKSIGHLLVLGLCRTLRSWRTVLRCIWHCKQWALGFVFARQSASTNLLQLTRSYPSASTVHRPETNRWSIRLNDLPSIAVNLTLSLVYCSADFTVTWMS